MEQQISSFKEGYFGAIYNGIRKGVKTADFSYTFAVQTSINCDEGNDLSTFYFQGLQEHAAYQNILSKGRKISQVPVYHMQL